MSNLYVGEYCIEQKTFHIELLDSAIEINKKLIKNEQSGVTFLPIAYGDYDQVSKQLDEFRKENNL